MSWNGEPISDDDARRDAASRSPRRAAPGRPRRATSRSSPRPRSMVRRRRGRRRGRRGRPRRHAGTPPTWSTAEVAVVTNVSIDHVEYLGPTRPSIAAEKAGIVEAGVDARARRDRPRARADLHRRATPARGRAATSTSGCARTCSRIGGRLVDLFTPYASYPDVFLPCTARTRPTTPRSRSRRRRLPRRAARVDARRRRVRVGAVAGSARGRRPPTRSSLLDGAHNVAGARALRAALDEEFADAPRTLVVGLLREKDAARDARRARRRRARRAGRAAAPTPRARDPDEVADAALDLGVDPENVEVVDRRRGRGRPRDRDQRPPTARSSSPARSTSSVPPGRCSWTDGRP